MNESKTGFGGSSEEPQGHDDALTEIIGNTGSEPLPSRAIVTGDAFSSDIESGLDESIDSGKLGTRFAAMEVEAVENETETENADGLGVGALSENTAKLTEGLADSEETALIKTEPAKPKKKRKVGILGLIGYALLLGGIIMLAVLGYNYYRGAAETGEKIEAAKAQVKKTWEEADDKSLTNDLGKAFALMRIPYLGKDWQMPVVVGVEKDDLYRGVGWFKNTALPGQVGNFAVAGHRGFYGYPFDKLYTVPKGSEVIVETKDHIYTYVLDNSAADKRIVDTEVWVLEPDPIGKKNPPDTARITLITCADLYSSPNRLVAFGHLEKTEKKK